MTPGKLVWFEIHSNDTLASRSFYADMFGWSFEPFAEFDAGYGFIRGPEGVGGGLSGGKGPGTTDERRSSLVYIEVSDLAAAVQKATKLGARLDQEITSIGEDGLFAVIRDLDGNPVGLWSSRASYAN